jgi:hypothetical protein
VWSDIVVVYSVVMASCLPFYDIKLNEKDVLGATFIHADLSCEALRRWLECRSLSSTGKKEIIEQS